MSVPRGLAEGEGKGSSQAQRMKGMVYKPFRSVTIEQSIARRKLPKSCHEKPGPLKKPTSAARQAQAPVWTKRRIRIRIQGSECDLLTPLDESSGDKNPASATECADVVVS